MSLISAANLLSKTDHLGAQWDLVQQQTASILALANLNANLTSTLADIQQEQDMLAGAGFNQANATTAFLASALATADVQGINAHCRSRGASVSSTIIDLPSYLKYLNTTPFSQLVTPSFAALWNAVMGSALPAAGVMPPSISATTPINNNPNALVNANGMASITNGSVVTLGASVPATSSGTQPYMEVTTNINGNISPSSVSWYGIDDLGNTSTIASPTSGTVWTGTSGTSPAALLTGVTITPAVTAQARQTVAFSSAALIVKGQVLIINAGLKDQETIYVETVSGNNVTAVFQQAHAGGATVSGNAGFPLTPTTTFGTGRRLVQVLQAAVTPNGASSGAWRICAGQDRVGV